MKSFTDQAIWRKSHDLALGIYRATTSFPDLERDCLVEDLRSTALNVETWIEMGLARRSGLRARSAFGIATAKLARMESEVISCKDCKLIDSISYRRLTNQIDELRKGLWPLAGRRDETIRRNPRR